MTKPLTKKQLRFLSFLKEHLLERGYPPTVREIMDGIGLSSTNIVKKYLDVLERKGYIKRQFNSPRAIEIIEAHIQEGDIVLVKPQPVANNGEIVVALINNEATVKRFYKKGNMIHLKPEHPTMKPIIIKEGQADVHIIGKVTTVIRQLDK